MPDPLTELPYDLWVWCVGLAVHDQPAGPLEFIMVSVGWQKELLHSPALWNKIYIQNDEDEMARICTFLHLSGSSPLDLYITTMLPATDSLHLIEPYLSRVRTISIMPKTPHPPTTSHAEQWKRAASNIMTAFTDRLVPWNASNYSCSGRRIGSYTEVYHVAVMQFLISYSETKLASTKSQIQDDYPNLSEEHKLFWIWENYITRCVWLLYLPRIVIKKHKSIVRDAAKKTVST
jgi:hypothetical protein